MSDYLKINTLLKRIKNSLVQDSYYSGSALFGLRRNKKKEEDQTKKENEGKVFDSPENEKLYKLGEHLGLSKEEIREALELIVKATAKYSSKLDVSTLILANDLIKYPVDSEFTEEIPKEIMKEFEEKYPDLYLAITNRFEFLCKYPKTISVEVFKKFSYSEILEFSRKWPEDYKDLLNKVSMEQENESI